MSFQHTILYIAFLSPLLLILLILLCLRRGLGRGWLCLSHQVSGKLWWLLWLQLHCMQGAQTGDYGRQSPDNVSVHIWHSQHLWWTTLFRMSLFPLRWSSSTWQVGKEEIHQLIYDINEVNNLQAWGNKYELETKPIVCGTFKSFLAVQTWNRPQIRSILGHIFSMIWLVTLNMKRYWASSELMMWLCMEESDLNFWGYE